jgi:hypothetical protein
MRSHLMPMLTVLLLVPHLAAAARFGFLTIPATKASRVSPIELRLSIKNDTLLNRGYFVDFYVDTFDPRNRITPQSIVRIVNAGTSALFSCFWDPRYYVGSRKLLYRVEDWTFPAHTVVGGPGSGWPIQIVNTSYKAPAIAPVAWIEPMALVLGNPDAYTRTQLEQRVDEMNAFQMKTIVIAYPEDTCYNGGPYYPSRAINGPEHCMGGRRPQDAEHRFHVLETILRRARLNGQKVIMGLGRGPWTPALAENLTPAQVRDRLAWESTVASEIWSLYGTGGTAGDYGDTIYGWYISTECGNFNAVARDYFDRSSRALGVYGLEKPVMISPCPPATNFTQYMASSAVSIFAFQDGVGAAFDYRASPPTSTYNHTSYTAKTIGQLRDQYLRYVNGLPANSKHVWAMSEAWRQAGANLPVYVGNMFYELAFQFLYERCSVSQTIFNEYLGCMKSPGNRNFTYPAAAEMFNNYVLFFNYWRDQ